MTVVHLHWSRNPKLVRETALGITVCGVKAPHEQLTAHLADTTCRACLEKARQEESRLEFWSADKESHAAISSGRLVNCVLAGTMPRLICRASVSSRTLSHPWSYCPLYLAIQSFGA
jgi:hypothetical protein